MTVRLIPQPPSAYVAAIGTSSMTRYNPFIKVTGFLFKTGTAALGFQTKYSGPTHLQGSSTSTSITPVVKISTRQVLGGTAILIINGTVIHAQSGYGGGLHITTAGRMDVNLGNPVVHPAITLRNLLQVQQQMQTPVILSGQPMLPTYVGRTTSPISTKGTYTINTPPVPSNAAHKLPVLPTWTWRSADIPGASGDQVLTWTENSGTGPSWKSNTAFAPTLATLTHYSSITKREENMGKVLNFHWRSAQHMAMTIDSANTMTAKTVLGGTGPKPYTVQFVMLLHSPTKIQYQNIWDNGSLVADGTYTDPHSGTQEAISDAVYQNKQVPVSDGQGNERNYFGLRPNGLVTKYNNTPVTPYTDHHSHIGTRPLVYTVVFNAGGYLGSAYIEGYGVAEKLVVDQKQSIVNNFLLGRIQGRIGSTSGAQMNLWEVNYFNRILTKPEARRNAHWLAGVYKFGLYH